MNEAQCLELRNLIIECTFPANEHGYAANRFRYVAVVPGGDGTQDADVDATVLYHYLPAVWERAGAKEQAEAFIKELVSQSQFHAKAIRLVNRTGTWDAPWSITAVSPGDDMPVLILLEKADGTVEGVLMREVGHYGSHSMLANAYPEPEQAQAVLSQLAVLEPFAPFMRWYKESNISAVSLDAACAQTPESAGGQKEVIVYRGDEWLFGIWNNPDKRATWATWPQPAMSLSSIADFHGSRVSKSKLAKRPGLDGVKGAQTVQGDCKVLEQALALAKSVDIEGVKFGEFEAHPGVKALCDWWNTSAPEHLRSAGCFRIYAWDDAKKIFHAGDPEEPAMQADALPSGGSYSLFERDGGPVIAVQFYRGRAFNKARSGGTIVFCPNGEEAYDVGIDPARLDEAYYSAQGLCASHIQAFAATAAV